MNVTLFYNLYVWNLIPSFLRRKNELRYNNNTFARRHGTWLSLMECYRIIIFISFDLMFLWLSAHLLNVEFRDINRPLSTVLMFLLCWLKVRLSILMLYMCHIGFLSLRWMLFSDHSTCLWRLCTFIPKTHARLLGTFPFRSMII